MKITFSSDSGKITEKDGKEVARIMEEFFKTGKDSEQAQITEERAKWIKKKLPECINIIKIDNRVIGSSLILPCTNKIMNLFLLKKINEEELFEAIQKSVSYKNMECVYLCCAVIIPDFRRRGLASMAFEKSIKKILGKNKIKPVLFYWTYSEEGKFLSEKIAGDLGFELKKRIKA